MCFRVEHTYGTFNLPHLCAMHGRLCRDLRAWIPSRTRGIVYVLRKREERFALGFSDPLERGVTLREPSGKSQSQDGKTV